MCWRARIVRFPVRVPRSITGPSPRLLRLFVGAQDRAPLVAVGVQVRRHAHLEVRASQPRGVWRRCTGSARRRRGRARRPGCPRRPRRRPARRRRPAERSDGRRARPRKGSGAIAQERRHRIAAVVEDPAQVAAHERHVREHPERAVRDRVAHAVDQQRAALDGLEGVGVLPERYGPRTWKSTNRCGGSQMSISVVHRTGKRCSTSEYSQARAGRQLPRDVGRGCGSAATEA